MNGTVLPCIGKTWAELEPITNGETLPSNTNWPESCTGKTLSFVVKPANNGNGEMVKTVNATVGGIGYPALPDAKANGAVDILEVQNNGQGTEGATYASPEAIGAVANCEKALYEVPVNARNQAGSTALNVDWSQVFGGKPGIGGSTYPICTLTYNLAWKNYKAPASNSRRGNDSRLHHRIPRQTSRPGSVGRIRKVLDGTLPQSEKPKYNVRAQLSSRRARSAGIAPPH